MPRTTRHDFGPGSYLEGVTLEVWPGRRCGGRRRLVARCSGSVRVACGQGWEHFAPVLGHLDLVEPGDYARGEAREAFGRLEAAWRGDEEAARAVASEMVEEDLDWTWRDPCEEEGE